MANRNLTDAELVEELALYGETVQLPLKSKKRPILVKKLNHLRARHHLQQSSAAPQTHSYNTTADQHGNIRQSEESPKSKQKAITSKLLDSPRPRTIKVSDILDHTRSLSQETLHSDDVDFEQGHSSTSYYPTSSKYVNDDREMSYRLNARDFVDEERYSSHLSKNTREGLKHRRTAGFNQKNVLFSSSDSINKEDDTIPSRLYPDISRYTSSFFSDSVTGDKNNKFESSDSDVDVRKSAAGSVQDKRRKTGNIAMSSSSSSPSHTINSGAYYKKDYPQKKVVINEPNRVHQNKSQYFNNMHFKKITFGVVILILLILACIVIGDYYYFPWYSSSGAGPSDNLLICNDTQKQDCYKKEVVVKALKLLDKLFQNLSSKKGQVLCGSARAGDDVISTADLQSLIYKNYADDTNAELLLECCLKHILANPHWKIRALKEDGTPAASMEDVSKLDAEVPSMSLSCRFRRSLTTVLFALCIVIAVYGFLVLLYLLVKYRLNQREREQREVYDMVERIIDVLRNNHEVTRDKDSDEPSYLAVQHVRDQLISPSERYEKQPIWDKAVAFIAANESRIRMETHLIRGDEFDVWYWIQPTVRKDKSRQRIEFDEVSDSEDVEETSSGATPCLMICNIFNRCVGNEDSWENYVMNSILEKCKNINSIVHICVDASKGCIYMKCSSPEAADQARHTLDGWWLDAQMISVTFIKTDEYHKRWPEARTATRPLKPSNATTPPWR